MVAIVMTDKLATFLADTASEHHDVALNSCGVWCVRWMMARTGISVALPDVLTWDAARSADVRGMFMDYVARFGLHEREFPSRGDVALFTSDERFVRHTGFAIGIFADPFWAFRSENGIRYMRHVTAAEVYG